MLRIFQYIVNNALFFIKGNADMYEQRSFSVADLNRFSGIYFPKTESAAQGRAVRLVRSAADSFLQ
jgi:hypothetical protein